MNRQDRSAITSSTAALSRTSECVICAEEVPNRSTTNALSAALFTSEAWPLHRSCCGQACCRSCLYRHMRSVWEDSTVGSRRPLVCPLGCGRPLADAEIRWCLHQQNLHWCWDWMGWLLYWLLWGWQTSRSSWLESRSCRRYRYWRYFCHTRGERDDLERYERWTLQAGWDDVRRKDDEAIVLRCPAPNCDYAWLVGDPSHRRTKQLHERRRVLLWYAAPKVEPVTVRTLRWVDPEFLHFDPAAHAAAFLHNGNNNNINNNNLANLPSLGTTDPFLLHSSRRHTDGRRMVCAKCKYVFCALCRQPWSFSFHRHSHRSCETYQRNLPAETDRDQLVAVASQTHARTCPGCRTLVVRSTGCNHMTCPCGQEWCYACGRPWNSTHYACVDRVGQEDGGGGVTAQCVIS